MATLLSKLKQEEAKDRLVDSAFLAFQMGAGGQKTFGEYLNELGLGDGQVKQQAKEQTITPQALATLKSLAKETEMQAKKAPS